MKPLLPLCFFALLIYSCKKDNNSSSSVSGPLLTLVTDSVFANGVLFTVDSSVNTYDANGRLKSRFFVQRASPLEYRRYSSYERDVKGRTTTITRKTETFDNGVVQPDLNAVINVSYQPGSDLIQFIYYHGFSEQQYDFTDSIVYLYSKSRLSASRVYMLTSASPTSLYDSNSFVFNDAGELTACSFHIQIPTQRSDYLFTYDSKTNPLKPGLEEIHDFNAATFSPGNVINQINRNFAGEDSFQFAFSYRDDGLPARVTTGQLGAAITDHQTFYYQ